MLRRVPPASMVSYGSVGHLILSPHQFSTSSADRWRASKNRSSLKLKIATDGIEIEVRQIDGAGMLSLQSEHLCGSDRVVKFEHGK